MPAVCLGVVQHEPNKVQKWVNPDCPAILNSCSFRLSGYSLSPHPHPRSGQAQLLSSCSLCWCADKSESTHSRIVSFPSLVVQNGHVSLWVIAQ